MFKVVWYGIHPSQVDRDSRHDTTMLSVSNVVRSDVAFSMNRLARGNLGFSLWSRPDQARRPPTECPHK